MPVNPTALEFIKQHEGCSLTAYADQGNTITIGYGATGPDIVKGLIWTKEQADFRLELDITKTEMQVLKLLKRTLPLGATAALISFAFNLGSGALASSHLLQCVNVGDDLGAAKAFLAWSHIGKTEIKGLLIRRMEEAVMYLKGVK
jgi:lysozyme